jgi:hypothetical protein
LRWDLGIGIRTFSHARTPLHRQSNALPYFGISFRFVRGLGDGPLLIASLRATAHMMLRCAFADETGNVIKPTGQMGEFKEG